MNRFQPKSRKAWRAWLAKHHATSSGICLIYAKKHTGIPSLSYNDAVEEALCFGWIDNKINAIDDQLYMQAFTPRKPKSLWSPLNKTRVAKLLREGLMTPAGQAAIDLAMKNGHWTALDHVETLTLPEDLVRALKTNATARKTFDAYRRAIKKSCLYLLSNAKRPETRARYLAKIIDAAAKGESPFAGMVAMKPAAKKKST